MLWSDRSALDWPLDGGTGGWSVTNGVQKLLPHLWRRSRSGTFPLCTGALQRQPVQKPVWFIFLVTLETVEQVVILEVMIIAHWKRPRKWRRGWNYCIPSHKMCPSPFLQYQAWSVHTCTWTWSCKVHSYLKIHCIASIAWFINMHSVSESHMQLKQIHNTLWKIINWAEQAQTQAATPILCRHVQYTITEGAYSHIHTIQFLQYK